MLVKVKLFKEKVSNINQILSREIEQIIDDKSFEKYHAQSKSNDKNHKTLKIGASYSRNNSNDRIKRL